MGLKLVSIIFFVEYKHALSTKKLQRSGITDKPPTNQYMQFQGKKKSEKEEDDIALVISFTV